MSPRYWRAGSRQHDHAPFKNAICLAEELEEALRRQVSGSARAATVEGELAGLRAKGSAPVKPGSLAGSPDYRAGYLGGHLLGRWLRDGQTLPPQAPTFAVTYGRALVDPGMEEMLGLPPPENAIGFHALAWTQTAAKSGPMSPELRRATLDWLRDGLGITISKERAAAAERRWQERESCQDPATPHTVGSRQPLSSIRVVAGASPFLPGHMGADTPSIAFGLSDVAWNVAREGRYDLSVNPLTNPAMRGFLELRVGERVVLSKSPVSVFAAACRLARARLDGFPDFHPVCIIDDCTGSWALHMVRDPSHPLVQVTEIYKGASASVELGALADVIDAFLHRFAREAATRISDVSGWSELRALAGYMGQ